MSDRRAMILETARRLFGERGYNGVSMRDIAGELGCSVGNVTYYFKKKEELMEACVLEQSQNYHLPPTPVNLIQLNQLFLYICGEIQGKIYYFYHYTQMAQISRRIEELQRAYTRDLYLTLKGAFDNLRETGDMEKEAYAGETEYFVQSLMTAMTYWAPHNAVLEKKQENGSKDFLLCMWSLIDPRLTEKGEAVLNGRILKKWLGKEKREQKENLNV